MMLRWGSFGASFFKLVLILTPLFGVPWSLLLYVVMRCTMQLVDVESDWVDLSFRDIAAQGLIAGAEFGVVFGFFAALMVRDARITLPLHPDRNACIERLDAALASLGYGSGTRTEAQWVLRPSFRAGRLAGNVTVEFEEPMALITGPAIHLRRLKRALEHEPSRRA